jgi:hypothetical protein
MLSIHVATVLAPYGELCSQLYSCKFALLACDFTDELDSAIHATGHVHGITHSGLHDHDIRRIREQRLQVRRSIAVSTGQCNKSVSQGYREITVG